jgi:hypothetical protein
MGLKTVQNVLLTIVLPLVEPTLCVAAPWNNFTDGGNSANKRVADYKAPLATALAVIITIS